MQRGRGAAEGLFFAGREKAKSGIHRPPSHPIIFTELPFPKRQLFGGEGRVMKSNEKHQVDDNTDGPGRIEVDDDPGTRTVVEVDEVSPSLATSSYLVSSDLTAVNRNCTPPREYLDVAVPGSSSRYDERPTTNPREPSDWIGRRPQAGSSLITCRRHVSSHYIREYGNVEVKFTRDRVICPTTTA